MPHIYIARTSINPNASDNEISVSIFCFSIRTSLVQYHLAALKTTIALFHDVKISLGMNIDMKMFNHEYFPRTSSMYCKAVSQENKGASAAPPSEWHSLVEDHQGDEATQDQGKRRAKLLAVVSVDRGACGGRGGL